jgi:hypothetical protein
VPAERVERPGEVVTNLPRALADHLRKVGRGSNVVAG